MGYWPGFFETYYFPSKIKVLTQGQREQANSAPGGSTISEYVMCNGDPDIWMDVPGDTYRKLDDSACVPEAGLCAIAKDPKKIDQLKTFSIIDSEGDVIAPGPFRYASDFRDGFARVEWKMPAQSGKSGDDFSFDTAVSKDGLYAPLLSAKRFRTVAGLISARGNLLPVAQSVVNTDLPAKENNESILLQVNEDGQFSSEPAAFRSKDHNSKYGFIGTNGQVLLDKKFDYARNFCEGVAIVMMGSEYQVIKPDGSRSIERTFQYIDSFSDGLAAFVENDLWGYVDHSGKVVIEPQYSDALNFHDGIAAVRSGNHYCLINKLGKIIAKTKFYGASTYSCGLLPVLCSNGLWGYADKSGAIKIKPRFERVRPFSEGRAVVIDTASSAKPLANQATIDASQAYAMGQAYAGITAQDDARKYLEIASNGPDRDIAAKARHYLKIRMLDKSNPDELHDYYKIQNRLESKQIAEAIAAGEAAILKHPSFFQLHVALAYAYVEGRNYAAADKLLQDVIAESPDYARAYVVLSKSLKAQGRNKDALKFAKLAVEKDPLDFWTHQNMTQLTSN